MKCRLHTQVRTACPCKQCEQRRWVASRLVDREADLRDIREDLRPFVLAEREKRNPTRVPIGGGNPNGETAISLQESQYEGRTGPWHDNAVGSMEDGE